MRLALFDLDNTILAGDSDHAWGEFIVEKGLVDGDSYRKQNDAFYQEYLEGGLDIVAYQRFVLNIFKGKTLAQIRPLQEEFLAKVVTPMIKPKAKARLDEHRKQGDYIIIITATNSLITEMIASYLQVHHLIATTPEIINDCVSGNIIGVPSFQQGKVLRLQSWLEGTSFCLNNSFFYSDSWNDIPLLEQVTYPFVVDADDKLKHIALSRGWPILNFIS